MKVIFKINYHTVWGQRLYVCGTCEELGRENTTEALALRYVNDGNWEGAVEIDARNNKTVSYKYLIKHGSEENVLMEWGANRTIDLYIPTAKVVQVIDAWRPEGDEENALMSQAFVGNLFGRQGKNKGMEKANHANLRLRLIASRVGKHQSICVIGNTEELGAWDAKKAVVMSDKNYPFWQAEIALNGGEQAIEYKYGIYDHQQKKLVEWEYGDNRHFLPEASENAVFSIKTDIKFRYPFGKWRGAGVAIPVFALRSEKSGGVGEFNDLKLLIDWAAKTHLKLVQILPINDTIATHTWTDSYPYAAISVFALHPMYLNMSSIGILKNKKLQKDFDEKARKLNALPQIDYEAMMKLKSSFFKKIYDQEKKKFFADHGFQTFFSENKSWLIPYAAFSRLRDKYGTPDFSKWEEHSIFYRGIIEDLVKPENEDFDDYGVHFFIQYHLHLQMQAVTAYARKRGVVLKGDIPIGIYRYSVDAWVKPQLYHMDKQAGAPPDAYAVSGQNWGFPTYNWEEMAKDNFAWWRRRLAKMAMYFDAYRIDHILGFFRIWEIPWSQIEGLMGQFNPAIPMFRYELEGNGLHFDYIRFCKPYIREYMLAEIFGDDREAVKKNYLHKGEADFYYMRDEFDTQRKVEEYFEAGKDKIKDQALRLKIKKGLFALISNVILLEDAGGYEQGYHPRIAMHYTYSYRELDEAAKAALDKIYVHYYYERQEKFWRDKAMIKLPAIIHSTNMLVCGEDLGMVPDCVPDVMDELGVLNLEIQRMPKNSKQEFSHPSDSKYLSVVSPSCHDMSTIRGWWEEDHEQTERFYHEMLGHTDQAPQFCEPWICKEMIVQHLHGPAMWAIFPIQDLVAMDENLRLENPFAERINEPSNPRHYWRYRFHLTLEQLLASDGLNKHIENLMREAGRDGQA